MNYSSVLFVFFFLVGLTTFLFLPMKARKPWLLLLSLLWFSYWGLGWALFFILVSSFNYASLRLIQSPRGYSLLLAANVLLFILLRSGLFVSTPLGTSFILFMLMGVVIDRWRGGNRPELPSWLDFILFSQFFLFLMAGPVEKGARFFEQLAQGLKPRPVDVIDGGLIFSLGFLKAAVLFPALSKTIAAILAMGQLSYGHYPVLGLFFALALYLELSGLCDIGRGAARCFGLNVTVNFRSMLFSRSPSDFWLRWNITVSAWFRDNVSMPLMLRFGRQVGQKPLLLLTFILMGLWHGLELRWLLFGLFNGLVVITSLSLRRPLLDRALVWIMIVGNGLLAHGLVETPTIQRSWVEVIQAGFGWRMGVLALAWFFIEWREERSQQSDGFLNAPLWGKVLMLLVLGWSFSHALNMDLLANGGQHFAPIYFQL